MLSGTWFYFGIDSSSKDMSIRYNLLVLGSYAICHVGRRNASTSKSSTGFLCGTGQNVVVDQFLSFSPKFSPRQMNFLGQNLVKKVVTCLSAARTHTHTQVSLFSKVRGAQNLEE